jgi:hypothetical protein
MWSLNTLAGIALAPDAQINLTSGALNGEIIRGQNINIASASVGQQTPIPAALPLFATGIGGLGLLGWRRKRKVQAVARTNK